MFGNRRASQKPDDELISKFRRAFPHVVSAPPITMDGPDATALGPPTVDPMNSPTSSGGFNRGDGFEADDTAPENMQDLRFTWCFMDPNSFDYSLPLTNQTSGYFPPSINTMDPMFHGQPAGGLNTSPMALGSMPTPVPLSNHVVPPPHHTHSSSGSTSSGSSSRRSSCALGFDHFNPQYFPPQFHDLPFGHQASSSSSSSFAAPGSSFLHHHHHQPHHDSSTYSPIDNRVAGRASPNDVDMQLNPPAYQINPNPPLATDRERRMDTHNDSEKFQYNVTLRAPTAMIKHPKEIPVTYLNKGQAYTLSVVHSNPPPVDTKLVRYRTYVRVSFEEEEQRSKVAACWQLWKEGRGLSESHQRGGKLLAVECADPIQGATADGQVDRQVQLESASFDGFCVSWTADPTSGVSYCAISVRFNFLSTDFSHSKGVKGVPVRLCTKTQMISPDDTSMINSGADASAATAWGTPEVSYCKVKLFRDHGAERKLSNDVAHVKKAIEKLKQQIAQAEIGAGGFGKRKRGSISAARPAKLLKHSRSWSFGLQTTATDGSDKLSIEDDLHTRLVTMQDMFSSTRPVSVLSLRGEEQDDPDLHPVQLPLELHDPAVKVRTLRHQSTQESLNSIDAPPSLVALSPTNSTVSLSSPRHPSSHGRSDSGYHSSHNSFSELSDKKRLLDHPTKIPRVQAGGNAMPMGYIEAVDVDPSYQPPMECRPRPVACIFVRLDRQETQQQQQQGNSDNDNYYRAIYLTERTVNDLKRKISEKLEDLLNPDQIVRIVHVNRNGLKVMVDDDMIRELPDGQDMVAEFSRVPSPSSSYTTTSTSMSTPTMMNDAVEVLLKY